MLTGKKIRIYGKVQGVGFRHFTLRIAETLGVKGYVKNEESGTVLVYAVGEEEVMKEFVEYCKKGSVKSKVELVEVFEAEAMKFTSFEIRK